MPELKFHPLKTMLKSVAFAIVCSAIGFFIGNFVAISALMLYSTAKHITPDYTIAYRYVGLTCAGIGFVAGLVIGVVWDIRQTKEDWNADSAALHVESEQRQ